jgi:hypothetical protein
MHMVITVSAGNYCLPVCWCLSHDCTPLSPQPTCRKVFKVLMHHRWASCSFTTLSKEVSSLTKFTLSPSKRIQGGCEYSSLLDVMLDLDGLTLKMEALWSFKSSGTTRPVTKHQIPKDWNIQQHCCASLKPKESYVNLFTTAVRCTLSEWLSCARKQTDSYLVVL